MKRLILCSSILIIIIISSIAMLFTIKKNNIELTQKINQAMILWEDNKTDEAIIAVDEISEYWEHYYILMSFIITSDKMQSIIYKSESIKLLLKIIYENEFLRYHIIIWYYLSSSEIIFIKLSTSEKSLYTDANLTYATRSSFFNPISTLSPISCAEAWFFSWLA